MAELFTGAIYKVLHEKIYITKVAPSGGEARFLSDCPGSM